MEKILIKLFILCSLTILSSILYSQNYDLNINLNDGTTITIAIDDIQRIEFDNITSIDDSDNTQQTIPSVTLKQNYPNPFNPSTTIKYKILKTSKVKVCIYNINGQLVNEILNKTQSEGDHQVIWNGKDLNNESVASGIYIYSVKSEDLILSKKMILLK